MKNHKNKQLSRFKIGFALIAFVLGMFALSSFMGGSEESIVTGISVASILPMGIMRGPDGHGGGGGQTEEEKLFIKISEKVDKETRMSFKKLIEENAEFKSLKSVLDKMEKAATDEDVKKIKSQIDEIGLNLKALEEQKKKGERVGKTFAEAVSAAFEAKKDEFAKVVKGGQDAPFKIEIKAADVMSVENTIGAGTTQVTITEDLGIISTIRRRELTYLANVSVGRIGTSRALWIEEQDEEGTPIMIGEGDAKTQLDVHYQEETKSVKKIAVYGKVTTELMADLPQLVSYIKNNLMRRMDLVIEDQLFDGNDTGDNLAGVIGYATAFSAGNLADQVVDANYFDVIEAVAAQVKRAFGIPNVFYMHPDDVSLMKLIKDDSGRPVWKDYVTIEGEMRISGMKIVETTAITAGEFVGGDFTVVNVLYRDEMGIQIGLDGNDFTQNKKTILVEKRLVQFVSGNDTGVLVTGTFADAILDLDSVLS